MPPNGPAQTWRQLAVEVTPEKVWVFWEGEAIGYISSEQLRKVSREILANPRTPSIPLLGMFPGRRWGSMFIAPGRLSVPS